MAKKRKNDIVTVLDFLQLVFDLQSPRAKEIILEMKKQDGSNLSFQDYAKNCLLEIPRKPAERMFICFSLGSLYGEHKTRKEMTAD